MPTLLADATAAAAVIGLASARRRRAEGWFEAVVRHTWKPAAYSVASLLSIALMLQYAFPGVRTLGEVLALVR
jgi:hypothetical protein